MPVTNDIDTGVAANPSVRPSTFTPFNLVSGLVLNRPLDTADSGTNSNPAPISNTFDDVSNIPVVASPGY